MSWPHATVSQRARIGLLAFITIAVTAVISFSSLRNLADRAGFHDLSWLFPVCLDAVAALGVELWLSNSRARRGAMALALGAIVLSTVGNIYDWGIRSQLWAVPNWLAPALGAIPPLGLAFLLLVLHAHAGTTRGPSQPRHATGGTVTKSVPSSRGIQVHPAPMTQASANGTGVDLQLDPPSPAVDNPSTGPVAPARKPRTSARTTPGTGAKRTDEELVALIRDHEQDHGQMTRRLVMSTYHVGSTTATKLLAAARNGQGPS